MVILVDFRSCFLHFEQTVEMTAPPLLWLREVVRAVYFIILKKEVKEN